MFQEALQFCSTIVLCYNKQTTMRFIGRVPSPLTWQLCQTIVDCLSPIVFARILNQSHGHRLLSDALHSTISMSLKLKEENQVVLSFETKRIFSFAGILTNFKRCHLQTNFFF
jgi:hypothetical protein